MISSISLIPSISGKTAINKDSFNENNKAKIFRNIDLKDFTTILNNIKDSNLLSQNIERMVDNIIKNVISNGYPLVTCTLLGTLFLIFAFFGLTPLCTLVLFIMYGLGCILPSKENCTLCGQKEIS